VGRRKRNYLFPALERRGSGLSLFPEPDLPRLHIYSKDESGGLFNLQELEKQMSELPWEKKERIMELCSSSENANLLIQDEKLMNFF